MKKTIYKKSFAYTHSFDRRYCSHSIPIPLDGVTSFKTLPESMSDTAVNFTGTLAVRLL